MIEGANHWPDYIRFRDRFAEAMDPRFYTIEWLDRKIWSGEFRLWANDGAAIVAEIKEYPTGAREVAIFVAAGIPKEIVKFTGQVEAWGRSCGAIRGDVTSHPAWGRLLKDRGYEMIQTVLKREL